MKVVLSVAKILVILEVSVDPRADVIPPLVVSKAEVACEVVWSFDVPIDEAKLVGALVTVVAKAVSEVVPMIVPEGVKVVLTVASREVAIVKVDAEVLIGIVV